MLASSARRRGRVVQAAGIELHLTRLSARPNPAPETLFSPAEPQASAQLTLMTSIDSIWAAHKPKASTSASAGDFEAVSALASRVRLACLQFATSDLRPEFGPRFRVLIGVRIRVLIGVRIRAELADARLTRDSGFGCELAASSTRVHSRAKVTTLATRPTHSTKWPPKLASAGRFLRRRRERANRLETIKSSANPTREFGSSATRR